MRNEEEMELGTIHVYTYTYLLKIIFKMVLFDISIFGVCFPVFVVVFRLYQGIWKMPWQKVYYIIKIQEEIICGYWARNVHES